MLTDEELLQRPRVSVAYWHWLRNSCVSVFELSSVDLQSEI